MAEPAHDECQLREIQEISNQVEGASVFMGAARQLHINDSIRLGLDRIDLEGP